MPKITLNTLQGSFADVNVLNQNFTLIADMFDNETLSRDNRTATEANQLESNIDINSKVLFNIPNGTQASDAVNFAQLQGAAGGTAFVGTAIETADADPGQTVFNLGAVTYTPGINNLSVFLRGARQEEGRDYTETNLSTVTFLEGVDDGDRLVFIVNETPVAGTTVAASAVSVTVQGTGTNVSAYLNSVNTLTGSKTFDFPSLASLGTTSTTVTVTGALTTQTADAYMDQDLLGVQLTAFVSSAGVVTVRATNSTGAPVDLASGTLSVRVHKV